jgi:hypothetical protein
MESMPRNAEKLCSICGVREATTRDHIPPKAIFPKPRPTLITVPACQKCNLGSSRDDENFRNYLSLHVGAGDAPRSFLFRRALSSLERSPRALGEVLQSSQEVHAFSPSGLYLGTAIRALWNSKAHDAVVERCVRGLYFHHFGAVLGEKAVVRVQWLRRSPFVPEVMDQLSLVVVKKGQFAYRFGRSPEKPRVSVWVFNFYDRHFASGYTVPSPEGLPNA